MTTHRPIGNAERSLLPRALLARPCVPVTPPTISGRPRRTYYARWKFKVGQAVTLGPMDAVVISRSRTAMGRQLYQIAVIGEDYGRPCRYVLGSALTAGSSPVAAARFLEVTEFIGDAEFARTGMRKLLPSTEYDLVFEINQRVSLKATGETAIVTGRVQIEGCLDEYIVELVGSDADPLRVLDFQIEAT
jgi:hypothetical protein